jgi:hypothetical protein
MPNGAAPEEANPVRRWSTSITLPYWLSQHIGFEAQWGAPMAENAGAVLLGLVVIILACVSILAASHVW